MMIYATSSATVPKQTVVTRKAYGAGIYAMGGPAYDPESVIGLPSGEIGIMGPEAAINAVYARKLAAIDDPGARETEVRLREEYREDIDIHRMASEVVIDEIVPPPDAPRNWLPASRSTRTWRRTCRTRNTGRSSDSPDYSAVAHSGPSSPRAPPNPRATAIPTASSARDVRGGSDPATRRRTAVRRRTTAFVRGRRRATRACRGPRSRPPPRGGPIGRTSDSRRRAAPCRPGPPQATWDPRRTDGRQRRRPTGPRSRRLPPRRTPAAPRPPRRRRRRPTRRTASAPGAPSRRARPSSANTTKTATAP